MADLAHRFKHNPLITPVDVTPSTPGLRVECVLNPGAFRNEGRIGLLMRVAESAPSDEKTLSVPVLNPSTEGGIETIHFDRNDPQLDLSDPRIFTYRGQTYLTTLSHLRLAWSDDGLHFRVEDKPVLTGQGPGEAFGIEDCRVSQIGDTFYLTYSAAAPFGIGVGLASTRDWKHYERHGWIFTTDNKDCALFEECIGGTYYALNRPSNVHFKGNHIWLSRSPDLLHWGGHHCLARTRPGMWDSARVGGGAAPIRTEHGWLAIYHGADEKHRYCLGALLLDLSDPARVIARSHDPIMEPLAEYEQKGFFGNVVFTNGHIIQGDDVLLYYGASDTVICGARLSITEILNTL